MRLLLLALMIALLPLRGWVGDVMAMEMPAGLSFATNNIATHADTAGAGGHIHVNTEASHTPCHGHDGAAADARADKAGSQDNPGPDPCSHCSACQICHTVAVTAAISLAVDTALPHLLWPAGGLQFASAIPAPHLKPPIS
jgi:hypothetical protein